MVKRYFYLSMAMSARGHSSYRVFLFPWGDRLPSPNPRQAQIDALAARVVTLEGEVKDLKAKLKYMVTNNITGEFASVSGGHIENYLSNTN